MNRRTFNLRDLFWLVLVCALGTSWWQNAAALRRAESDLRLVEELLKEEGYGKDHQGYFYRAPKHHLFRHVQPALQRRYHPHNGAAY